MSAKYYGDRSTPKPPDDIWNALSAAGKSGDPVALGIARSRYIAWLDDQGIAWRHEGSARPDAGDA